MTLRLFISTVWIAAAFLSIAARAGEAPATPFDHSRFDHLLRECVTDGVVDYPRFAEKYSELQAYLDSLTSAPFQDLPHDEKIAMGLNAYNGFCIQGVLSQRNIKSVRDVWYFFKRTRFVLGGQEMSLDSLEHDILRKMGDPRIHFGLVCASKGCPKLSSRAYVASTLNEDLDQAARNFLRDKTKNYLDQEKKRLYLSALFKWFKKDFLIKSPSLIEYVKPYLSEEDSQFLSENKVKVEFLEYDWSLNGPVKTDKEPSQLPPPAPGT